MKTLTANGFTFIELMVAVVIIAILSVISMNLYTSRVRESRRTDATNVLTGIAMAEERYRSNNTQYGTLAQVWNGVSTSPEGYYNLSISGLSSTGYTLTATAIGNQANDATNGVACNSMQLSVSNSTITKTPLTCWPQ